MRSARGATTVQSVTTSVDELLARPEVAALVVCVRNDLCPDILHAAVEAGKPVLFEKPGGAHCGRPAGRRGPGT